MRLRTVLSGLAAALLIAGAALAGGDPVAAFRTAYIDHIREADPTVRIEVVSPMTIRVTRTGDAEPMTLNLENVYGQVVANPAEEDTIIARHVRVMLTAQSLPIEADSLVVLLRPTGYADAVAEATGAAGDRPLTRPFAGDLVLIIAINGEESFQFPGGTPVHEAVPAGDDDLWRRATRNIARIAGEYELTSEPGGFVLGEPPESLGPSVLLDEAFWRRPQVSVLGEDVVALLYKNAFVLVAASNRSSIDVLQRMLEAEAGNPNLIADTLFIRQGGRWRVYTGN